MARDSEPVTWSELVTLDGLKDFYKELREALVKRPILQLLFGLAGVAVALQKGVEYGLQDIGYVVRSPANTSLVVFDAMQTLAGALVLVSAFAFLIPRILTVIRIPTLGLDQFLNAELRLPIFLVRSVFCVFVFLLLYVGFQFLLLGAFLVLFIAWQITTPLRKASADNDERKEQISPNERHAAVIMIVVAFVLGISFWVGVARVDKLARGGAVVVHFEKTDVVAVPMFVLEAGTIFRRCEDSVLFYAERGKQIVSGRPPVRSTALTPRVTSTKCASPLELDRQS
ncbi:MAG: hypothetical protein AAGA08_04855 [Pseudomonadota bacterium]